MIANGLRIKSIEKSGIPNYYNMHDSFNTCIGLYRRQRDEK